MERKHLSVKQISFIGVFTAITAILAQISVPLPFTPVPVSLGILAVYITGILLTPKLAFFSQIVYLALGLAGIPIFSGFRGGISVFAGPTGGFLMAYPFMVVLVSFWFAYYNYIMKNTKPVALWRTAVWAFLVLMLAQIICYVFGALWIAFIMGINLHEASIIGIYPFVIPDILKIAFCVAFVLPIRKRFTAIMA